MRHFSTDKPVISSTPTLQSFSQNCFFAVWPARAAENHDKDKQLRECEAENATEGIWENLARNFPVFPALALPPDKLFLLPLKCKLSF